MKRLNKVLVLLLACYVSISLLAQNQQNQQNPRPTGEAQNSPQQEIAPENNIPMPDDNSQEIDDDDSYPYEQDIISRKLFQKDLTPLTTKEKIIWSFRMAETNTFL
jgi:hypothetical protein